LLAADTSLLRAAGQAWRAGDPEAPDPAGMRPLYAEQAGGHLTVVLQGRMREERLASAFHEGVVAVVVAAVGWCWRHLRLLRWLGRVVAALLRRPGGRGGRLVGTSA